VSGLYRAGLGSALLVLKTGGALTMARGPLDASNAIDEAF
jgi:hypothetical protein